MSHRQCYRHVFDIDKANFTVTAGQVTLRNPKYQYEEKALLRQVNIGLFGYGVNIPIGSDWSKQTVTNYNYVRDPYELRWKHIDVSTGKVNSAAITTYDFKYTFYTDYYTYKAASLYQIDSYAEDMQQGTDCYSYIHTKTAIVQKNVKCK